MKLNFHQIGFLAALAMAAGSASASPYGTNITISDNNYFGYGWYSNREDQETETVPDTVTSQQWDLEGMFMSGSTLTLVGGYDFKNGVTWSDGHNYKSGDIFIDVDGNAVYGVTNGGSGATGWGSGPHTAITSNAFGYDYVLDLNFTTMKFDVIKLTSASLVTRVMDVAASNPWQYSSGGTAVAGYQGIAFSYTSGLTNAQTGFAGDSTNTTGYSTGSNQHYAIELDTSFLGSGTATFHYTMECGNDDLMGQVTVVHQNSVPETSSTALLLGGTLVGLVGIRRKRSV